MYSNLFIFERGAGVKPLSGAKKRRGGDISLEDAPTVVIVGLQQNSSKPKQLFHAAFNH